MSIALVFSVLGSSVNVTDVRNRDSGDDADDCDNDEHFYKAEALFEVLLQVGVFHSIQVVVVTFLVSDSAASGPQNHSHYKYYNILVYNQALLQ